MFTNLIESTSHAKEFKRRGSFLLFTTATYVVLFVITGVVSIYAYDARLDQQNLEIVQMLRPEDMVIDVTPPPAAPTQRPKATRETNESNITERAEATASVNVPQRTPDIISTTPPKNPPVPDTGPWAITGRNRDAGLPGAPGTSPGGGTSICGITCRGGTTGPPPPPADPPRPKIIVSKGPINGQAVSLPKPVYPPIAKAAGIQGTVSVQVLIDENGRVVSAKAIDGSPALRPEAQRAAMQARFSPTTLGGQPVKVSGVITYNFLLNR
jgi:protein TonB